MYHTADGQSDRYCILFIKFENNVNQITAKIERRNQNEIAFDNPKDSM